MTEYEQAEQEVAAAKVAERVAEWKAMEAKAVYYRYASEAMQASADVMGARIRRDNAQASEWADKALATAEQTSEPETHTGNGGEEFLLETQSPSIEDEVRNQAEDASPEVASEQGAEPQIPEGFTKWQDDTQQNPARWPQGATARTVYEATQFPTFAGGGIRYRDDIDWEFTYAYRFVREDKSEDLPSAEDVRGILAPETAEPPSKQKLVHSAEPVVGLDPEKGWQEFYDAKIAEGYGHTAAAEVADFYWKSAIEHADKRDASRPSLSVVETSTDAERPSDESQAEPIIEQEQKDESTPVLDAGPPSIPRSEIPEGAAVETFTDAGVETVKIGGITRIVEDVADTSQGDASVFAHGILRDFDEPEAKRFGIFGIEFGGKAKVDA